MPPSPRQPQKRRESNHGLQLSNAADLSKQAEPLLALAKPCGVVLGSGCRRPVTAYGQLHFPRLQHNHVLVDGLERRIGEACPAIEKSAFAYV